MEESTLWGAGTIVGLAILGASAGAAIVLPGGFSPGAFAATLFIAIFLASGFAMQLYRRGLDHAVLVGGLAGFAGVFAFFALPIGIELSDGTALDMTGVATLLIVPPLVAGARAAGGTLFLARGVKRYREK